MKRLVAVAVLTLVGVATAVWQFNWLNANSGGVQTVATLILVVITGVSVYLTERIAEQTRLQAEATTRAVEVAQVQRRDAVRPVLALDLDGLSVTSPPSTSGFELRIKNAGTGPAFGVSVTLVDMPLFGQTNSALVEGSPFALLEVGEERALRFRPVERAELNAWLDTLREERTIGDVVVACRDSLNGARTTRAQLVSAERLGSGRVYEVWLTSMTFGES